LFILTLEVFWNQGLCPVELAHNGRPNDVLESTTSVPRKEDTVQCWVNEKEESIERNKTTIFDLVDTAVIGSCFADGLYNRL